MLGHGLPVPRLVLGLLMGTVTRCAAVYHKPARQLRPACCFVASPSMPAGSGSDAALDSCRAWSAAWTRRQDKPSRRQLSAISLRGGAGAVDEGAASSSGAEGGGVGPLRVVRLSPAAQLPERGSADAVGYDLFAAEDTRVEARGSALVATGIAMAIPRGCYGRIAPRSGLAVKNGIHVGAGVVDPDYRGEVKVLLMNMSDVDFHAAAGTRVAQMILERCATPPVLAVDTLDDTARGDAGFGSTGR